MEFLNALFSVIVFACPLLLRQCHGESDFTVDANSSTTALWSELSTDLSPSRNDTNDNNSTTGANTTTPFVTGYTTEGPVSFNTTNSTTDSSTASPSVSSSPVNSTSESLQPSGAGGGQRFDLASFFGGVILAVGLFGLAFFIYKVCQAKRSGYSNL